MNTWAQYSIENIQGPFFVCTIRLHILLVMWSLCLISTPLCLVFSLPVLSGLCGDRGVLLHVAGQLLCLGQGSVRCEDGH